VATAAASVEMTDLDWRRLYLGEFEWKPHPLADVAKDYYDTCDAYDAAICGNPEGRPRHDSHYRAINRHAHWAFKIARRQAESRGYSADDLREAMREHTRWEERHGKRTRQQRSESEPA
jgi:hypothetical protein